MNSIVVSIVQFTSSDFDLDGTVDKCLTLIDRAAAEGAQLVVLPEVWMGLGYSSADAYQKLVQDSTSPTMVRLAKKAAEHGLYIVGSIYWRTEDGEVRNTAPLIDPSGQIVGTYDKSHLFDAPGRADLKAPIIESSKVTAGNELPVFDTVLGPVGITICSDLRFPEPYRILALRGARIIVNCSAFLAPRVDHWEFMLRTRAVENQVFVIGSGQVGIDPSSGIGFVGRSMVVDPWGTVIATASDTETVVTTRVDLSMVDSVRDAFPLLRQRRPQLYGDLSAPVGADGLLSAREVALQS
ncbi:carbon-nitrogen hydrolase family protein [Rhodococcus sp. MSC1_016]|uniref:carbon-nitrogen hydrolase family protein n=1 Tax=Rhodococcus sp. MSC1_016 TaxID=2909266 RepID=UPI00202DBA66|nr:nitrilase-related carbon-nitrogen hydrolase [Rhodococcus sp. MSC1_016]